jgi:hypothetical protein
LGRVFSVLLLEAERSSVGYPVEVVTIVGHELLGEVGSRDRLGFGLPGGFPREGERGRLRSLPAVLGAVTRT